MPLDNKQYQFGTDLIDKLFPNIFQWNELIENVSGQDFAAKTKLLPMVSTSSEWKTEYRFHRDEILEDPMVKMEMENNANLFGFCNLPVH